MMPSSAYVAMRLYGPVTACLAFLVLAVFVPRSDAVTTFALQPLEVLSVQVPLSTPVVTRLAMVIVAISSLASLGFYNYASLFPDHFKMEVFFDNAGLEDSLQALRLTPAEAKMIAPDYASHRARYFAAVDAEIATIGHGPSFFAVEHAGIHSIGHTSFTVEPVAGWQRYRVSEARGELQHTLEVAGCPTLQLLSFFEKLPSGQDYFSVSRRNPFSVLMKSRFKQMLAADRDSTKSTFRFVIVGLTRVRIWPWPSFSSTVYCADFENIGLIPVAYAVYR